MISESFGKVRYRAACPLVGRPAGADHPQPQLQPLEYNRKSSNLRAEALLLPRSSLCGNRELPRLIVTTAKRKGGEFYLSRDRKSGVLPIVGYQGRHSIDCNGTDWK